MAPFFLSGNKVLHLTWVGLTSHLGQEGHVMSGSGPSPKHALMDEIILRDLAT